MMHYDAYNWYWVVGGDGSQVYSSASGVYVPSDNPAHQKWLSDGGVPTQIDTNDNLGAVLAQHRARPSDPEVLDPYLTALVETMDGRQVVSLLDHENRIRGLENKPGLPEKPPLTREEFLKVIADHLR
jgi:hypothetical protein